MSENVSLQYLSVSQIFLVFTSSHLLYHHQKLGKHLQSSIKLFIAYLVRAQLANAAVQRRKQKVKSRKLKADTDLPDVE